MPPSFLQSLRSLSLLLRYVLPPLLPLLCLLLFLLRLLLGSVEPMQYLLVLLPGALLSLVGCPVFYYLSRQIAKIGD